VQGLAGDKPPQGNGHTTMVTKIPSMRAAIAEMFSRGIWPDRKGVSLYPYPPILFDARRKSLRACRAKDPWRATVAGRWHKITDSAQLGSLSRMGTARPGLFETFGPVRSGMPGRMSCLQIDRDGIILARPGFEIGPLVRPDNELAVRFRFRLVLPEDLWVHHAMATPRIRNDPWRFHVSVSTLQQFPHAQRIPPRIRRSLTPERLARLRRTRDIPWLVLAKSVNLATDGPLGDGQWHNMEIQLDRPRNHLKIWTDGRLKQEEVPKGKWTALDRNVHAVRLSFLASPGVNPSAGDARIQCPILFADVAVNLDRARAKDDGKGGGAREEQPSQARRR